ncbi:MAG: PDZ domain-containing protein [Magnetococcales bacterium]|nr:PDZ domain-containing protein [Magnetococcales bacterium]
MTVHPPEGVQIDGVLRDGPADKAGLQKNDILLKTDGKTITSMNHFLNLVANLSPGKEMVLTIFRKGEEREIKITPEDSQNHTSMLLDGRQLGNQEPPMGKSWPRTAEPWQGNAMPAIEPPGQPMNQPMNQPTENVIVPPEPVEPPPSAWMGVAPELSPNGVVLSRIAPGGPGERAGLKVGDMIVSINGQSVSSPRAMARILRNFLPGDLVEMTIRRAGQLIDVQAKLAPPPTEAP